MFTVSLRKIPGRFSICSPSRASTSKRRALDFARACFIEFVESRNQRDGKIINAVEAKIFKRIQNGAFTRARKARKDHELSGALR